MTLDPKQAKALYQLLSAQGVDCSKLKSENPFSPEFDKTPTGRQIQVMVEAIAPQLAVDLKREIGHIDTQPSLAMAAAMADNVDPSSFVGDLKAEHLRSNPQAQQEQTQQHELDTIAWLEAQTEASQRKREGDRKYEQRIAREAQQAEAVAQRAAEGRALEESIKQRQALERSNYQIARGNVVITD